MTRKLAAFVALATALAVLCIRLGVWQLDRLRERRTYNAELASGLARPPVPITNLGPNDGTRKAFVDGTPDYEHEFAQAGRSLNGSPGVYIFTPVKIDSARAVLVNRGWVYSPDAATVDLSRWRESRTRFEGYTRTLTAAPARATQVKGRTVRAITPAAVAVVVPYRTEAIYLVARDSGGTGAPARLPGIELTDGPHLSYAIQWFCFAAIAIVGAGIVVARARQSTGAGSTAA